ncbi:MAG: NAD(P)/FAD-dependent oxidoreductase [Geminicoccaceae bacterium]
MPSTTVVIVGAGHAGLAMSWHLGARGIDHVVLERGEVANSWRTERWESLRLLTPNWQSRLPSYGYAGDDPDGFRSMPETVAFIAGYARAISAPVRTWTRVTSLTRTDDGYRVATDKSAWRCRAVVIASGACNIAAVPRCAAGLPPAVATVVPTHYRRPEALPAGGVLVVGASATGVQLADEIHRSGRRVILSCGEHVRVPRTYRGRDIQWWMDRSGILDQRHDEVDDIARVRGLPSFQLVGSKARGTLDLNALTDIGVELVGRLAGIDGSRLLFSGALHNHAALADLKQARLLEALDGWAAAQGLAPALEPSCRYAPTRVPEKPRLSLDLARGEVSTIVWATGFRPDYAWLDVPVLDRKGSIRHEGGVTPSPGLYVIGLPFLRRRKSTLIDGAGDDARELAEHLDGHLETSAPAAWSPRARPSKILEAGLAG